MSKYISMLLAAAFAVFAMSAHAATYNVNGAIGAGTVVGTMETDGTLGVLDTSDIVNWSFTISAGNLAGGASEVIDSTNTPGFGVFGTAFTATSTELLFDFTGAGLVFFAGSSSNGWCLTTGSQCGPIPGIGAGTYIYYNADLFMGSLVPAQFSPSSDPSAVIGTLATPVPLPASLPMLLAAFGAFAFWRRRQSA